MRADFQLDLTIEDAELRALDLLVRHKRAIVGLLRDLATIRRVTAPGGVLFDEELSAIANAEQETLWAYERAVARRRKMVLRATGKSGVA